MRSRLPPTTRSELEQAAAQQGFKAVYVIGPRSRAVSKIGIADNPLRRLQDIQTGCWIKLRLWRYWWTLGRPMAIRIEGHILQQFNERRVSGEWIKIAPDALSEAVISTAQDMKIELFDDDEAIRKAWALSADMNDLRKPHRIQVPRMKNRRPLDY